MSLCEFVVELKRSPDIFFLGWPVVIFVRVSQADIAERKIGISLDGLFEVNDRFFDFTLRTLVPLETPLQIKPITFGIVGVILREL